MKNWKVILPLLVVILVVGYALSRKAPATDDDMAGTAGIRAEEPVDTGEPTGDADVDLLIDEITAAASAESDAMYTDDLDVAAEENEATTFTADYYEE